MVTRRICSSFWGCQRPARPAVKGSDYPSRRCSGHQYDLSECVPKPGSSLQFRLGDGNLCCLMQDQFFGKTFHFDHASIPRTVCSEKSVNGILGPRRDRGPVRPMTTTSIVPDSVQRPEAMPRGSPQRSTDCRGRPCFFRQWPLNTTSQVRAAHTVKSNGACDGNAAPVADDSRGQPAVGGSNPNVHGPCGPLSGLHSPRRLHGASRRLVATNTHGICTANRNASTLLSSHSLPSTRSGRGYGERRCRTTRTAVVSADQAMSSAAVLCTTS